jgi:hypothetical protein
VVFDIQFSDWVSVAVTQAEPPSALGEFQAEFTLAKIA